MAAHPLDKKQEVPVDDWTVDDALEGHDFGPPQPAQSEPQPEPAPAQETIVLDKPEPKPEPEAAPVPAVVDEKAIAEAHTQLEQVGTTSNPLDMPPEQFRAALERRDTNRQTLLDWLKRSLKEGTDYGRIHFVKKSTCSLGDKCTNPDHFTKPALFKPGAEQICGRLGVTATWPQLQKYEDAAVEGIEIKTIVLRCELLDGAGKIIATGIGARSIAQDYGDINKSLKMCKKSGHLDATLNCGGLSELFTQDGDDMNRKADGTYIPVQEQEQPPAPAPTGPPPGDGAQVPYPPAQPAMGPAGQEDTVGMPKYAKLFRGMMATAFSHIKTFKTQYVPEDKIKGFLHYIFQVKHMNEVTVSEAKRFLSTFSGKVEGRYQNTEAEKFKGLWDKFNAPKT